MRRRKKSPASAAAASSSSAGLSKCNYVTVAAIDGMCVGGGAELAMWCDRRILTDSEKTAYGFPEVKLGLFPGWGGTARTPRMVGLSNAVELVTGGENDRCPHGSRDGAGERRRQRIGRTTSDQLARRRDSHDPRRASSPSEFRRDRERWAGPIAISETELGFLGATASAYIQQQTKGHYPAPLAALEVMLGAAGVDVDTACQMEAEEFAKLFGSPINRALLNVFFLTRPQQERPAASRAT